MYNREQAQEVFLRYAAQYDMENILIRHKVEHTIRVAELSGRYANALGMDGEDADFAWLLGLLHDIGRFEIAMHNAMGMRLGQCIQHLENDFTRIDITERCITPYQVLEIETVDILHHQK